MVLIVTVVTELLAMILAMDRELGNIEDRFTVAVLKDNTVVGHVPHEYWNLCWNFLRHGG